MLMLRSQIKVAAVLGMSTWLPLADDPPVMSAENKDTPVLMCHGNADQVVSKLTISRQNISLNTSDVGRNDCSVML